MKVYHQILALIVLLALIIKEGLSLECYSCNSFLDDDCVTVGATTKVVVCGTNETMCRKVEQEVYYNGEDHTRVFRQCATRGKTGDCLERTGTYRFKSWYCQCDNEDLCNGAGITTMSVPLIIALSVALLVIRRVL